MFNINKVCGLSPHAFSRKFDGVAIDPVSSALGAVDLVGNWISQSKNRKQQYKMFQEQMAFQREENQKARYWLTGLADSTQIKLSM